MSRIRLKWLVPLLLLGGAILGVYVAWWKPLALAALRIALDSQLKSAGASGIKIGYDAARLSGFNTLTLTNVRIGDLDDPHSVLVSRLRFTFSMKDLIIHRFKAPAALRRVVLEEPQITVTLPSAKGKATTPRPASMRKFPPPLPLAPKVPLVIRNGRVLLRLPRGRPRIFNITDIDAQATVSGPESISARARMTLPDSHRHGARLRATLKRDSISANIELEGLDVEPLSLLLKPVLTGLDVKSGKFSCDLNVSLSRNPSTGSWALKRIRGVADPGELSVVPSRSPFGSLTVSGRIRGTGTVFSTSSLRVHARETAWIVSGSISGLSGSCLDLEARAPSFDVARLEPGLSGKGSCLVKLRGRADDPLVLISAELDEVRLFGLEGKRVEGSAELRDHFKTLALQRALALTDAGEIVVRGRLTIPEPAGEIEWTFSPSGPMPSASGTLTLEKGTGRFSARTHDGFWRLAGRAGRKGKEWKVKVTGQDQAGGEIILEGASGEGGRIDGTFQLARVSQAALYFPALPDPLSGLSVRVTASGRVTGTTSRPGLAANLEGSVLEIRGRHAKLKGNIVLRHSPELTALELSGIGTHSPDFILDGDGSLRFAGGGWRGSLKSVLSHLKAGNTDLETRAELTGSGKKEAYRADLKLKSVRLNAKAYPDLEASIASGEENEVSLKIIWEELLSAVVRFEGARNRRISLTAAFGGLPTEPLAGLASLPAPARSASGSITIKGPVTRSSVKASLNWAHGDLNVKGWTALHGGDFSLTADASEKQLSSWAPFVRELLSRGRKDAASGGGFPEIEAEFGTRSLRVEKRGGRVGLSGWLSLKDLHLNAFELGSGRLRILKRRDTTELEGSLEGRNGTYSLYPTQLERSGEGGGFRTEFSFKDVPVGKGQASLTRGGLRTRWNDKEGNAVLFLSGLALDDLECGDLSVRFSRKGSLWEASSPPDSAMDVLGTISIRGMQVRVEKDERCGGPWLKLKGTGGSETDLAGIWNIPAAPEAAALKCRRLPAALILCLLGVPSIRGEADADLRWNRQAEVPISGQLTLLAGHWGEFPFDRFEVSGTGAPGRGFSFTSLFLERSGSLKASGSGRLNVHPDPGFDLNLKVDRLLLGYLKPFGFVEESTVAAHGNLKVSGNPGNPEVRGTLKCDVGSFSPPLGFARLYLKEGRISFRGHQATISAGLADLAGAAVVVSGGANYRGLVPTRFSIVMTAPSPVRIDGLPQIYQGKARGVLKYEGTTEHPLLLGKVTLEEGRLANPPRRKDRDPDSLLERLSWDLKVRFGKNVRYALGQPGGAAVNLARLSPSPLSHIEIHGTGSEVQVYGEVQGESGPLTLFLGKKLWKKRPRR